MYSVTIMTPRFMLRELTESDASLTYLSWLHDDQTSNYIMESGPHYDIERLENYIEDKKIRENVLFFGIFDKITGFHIGNIKYEPIDLRYKYAVMGILVGERAWQGKGVASEVIKVSAIWLHDNLGIDQICLGVKRNNKNAMSAYNKIGFTVEDVPYIETKSKNGLSMILNIP